MQGDRSQGNFIFQQGLGLQGQWGPGQGPPRLGAAIVEGWNEIVDEDVPATGADDVALSGLGDGEEVIFDFNSRTNEAVVASSPVIEINGDTDPTNYAWGYLGNNDTTFLQDRRVASASPPSNQLPLGAMGDSGTADGFGRLTIECAEYTNTNIWKTMLVKIALHPDGSTVGRMMFMVLVWMNTDAITSIKLKPNTGSSNKFKQHTTGRARKKVKPA